MQVAMNWSQLSSPTWPVAFPPQHQRSPLVSIAQECAVVGVAASDSAPPPASIAATLVNERTATGVRRLLKVPSPSAPVAFPPQHTAVRLARTAHACRPPTEMAM